MKSAASCLLAGTWMAAYLGLSGCAYRLPVARPPSQWQIRLVARSQQRYVVRAETRDTRDYPVPVDGRVTLDIPAYRPGCSIYLFNRIKISNGANPLKTWTIHVVSGKTARTLSLKKLSSLPLDADGYRLLRLPD